MTHKNSGFCKSKSVNAMPGAIMLCLLLCLTICLPVMGCSKESDVTRVTASEKTSATSEETSVSESSDPTGDQTKDSSAGLLQGELEVTLNYKQIDDIASNQFAVWIEDSKGEFIRTLFVTSFTAGGGWEYREESLTDWVERSGLSSGSAQDIDAYSGATPKSGKQVYTWDCKDESGQTVSAGEYHFFVEGTIYWENAVIFEGVIDLGSDEMSAQAEAVFTNDEAKKSDMLTDVEAVYMP